MFNHTGFANFVYSAAALLLLGKNSCPRIPSLNILNNLFFDKRRYDLGKVGRYKINRRLNINSSNLNHRILSKDDIVTMLKKLIEINNGIDKSDDIDHLGNRRVRSVGELIQNQVRVGLIRLERGIKEKMTTQLDPSTTTPAELGLSETSNFNSTFIGISAKPFPSIVI